MNAILTLHSNKKDVTTTNKNSKDIDSKDDKNDIDFKDFLSNIIKTNDKKDENSMELLSKEINNQIDTKTDINKDKTDETTDISLDTMLNLVTYLKSNGLQGKFPTDTKKLDKVLNNEQALQDFKNVKNMDDILKVAKKYNIKIVDFKFEKQSNNNIKNFQTDDKTPQISLSKDNKQYKTTANSIFHTSKIKQNQANQTSKISSPLKKLIHTKTNQNNIKPTTKRDNNTIQQNNINVENEISANNTNVKYTKPNNNSNKNEKKVNTKTKITQKNEVKVVSNTNISESFNNSKDFTKTDKNNNLHKIDTKESENKNKKITKDIQKQPNIEKNGNSLKTENIFLHQNHINHTETKSVQHTETITKFTSDLKEQINNYKPPIMKIKMTLNPKNLGEVDVSMINRGNSLQVNISSNTNTMAIFTQNQAEFKNSLVNMGFTNLNMNFNSNSNSNKDQQHSQKNSKNFNETTDKEIEDRDMINITIPIYT